VEDPDVDGRIILKWIFRTCGGGMDWVDLAKLLLLLFRPSPYRAVNTLRLCYKNQSVNIV